MWCLAETIGPGKLLSQVLWSQITHLKRQETRQWACRDCECLRYVTNMHTHTFLKLCSPSRRNVRTRSLTVLPTSDRKRQDRWQRWTDNSACFPSQTNFLLCLGRRWGQTSRRIGGQGGKRRCFSRNSMTAIFYPIKTARLRHTCIIWLRVWRREDCWPQQRKKRVDSCGAWKSSHINKGSRLKLQFMPFIKCSSLGLDDNTWQTRPKVLSCRLVYGLITFHSDLPW